MLKKGHLFSSKDKSIGFDKYIDNSVLWIYWNMSRNISGYSDTKYQQEKNCSKIINLGKLQENYRRNNNICIKVVLMKKLINMYDKFVTLGNLSKKKIVTLGNNVLNLKTY